MTLFSIKLHDIIRDGLHISLTLLCTLQLVKNAYQKVTELKSFRVCDLNYF